MVSMSAISYIFVYPTTNKSISQSSISYLFVYPTTTSSISQSSISYSIIYPVVNTPIKQSSISYLFVYPTVDTPISQKANAFIYIPPTKANTERNILVLYSSTNQLATNTIAVLQSTQTQTSTTPIYANTESYIKITTRTATFNNLSNPTIKIYNLTDVIVYIAILQIAIIPTLEILKKLLREIK